MQPGTDVPVEPPAADEGGGAPDHELTLRITETTSDWVWSTAKRESLGSLDEAFARLVRRGLQVEDLLANGEVVYGIAMDGEAQFLRYRDAQIGEATLDELAAEVGKLAQDTPRGLSMKVTFVIPHALFDAVEQFAQRSRLSMTNSFNRLANCGGLTEKLRTDYGLVYHSLPDGSGPERQLDFS